VRLEEVIDDPNEDKVYVVMEFLSGGPIYVEGRAPSTSAFLFIVFLTLQFPLPHSNTGTRL
jgi:hypothetical protein